MIDREREVEARVDERAGETGTGAFRGPYYNFVGRIGPYPSGPTTKGIHTPPDDDAPPSLLGVDDQTAGEAPTTEKLLETPPPAPREGEEGEGYDPLNPELEPEPGEPGVPVIAEQPGFAYGDPGTGLENIHIEDPDAEGGPGPEPEPTPELVIATPVDGSTVLPVHDVGGTGASSGGSVELWYVQNNQQVATTTADPDGNWLFGGDQAAALGAVTWEVREGSSSAQVTVTVEEEEAPAADWEGMTRHADLDDYLKGRRDLSPPEVWGNFTVADKKAWLDQKARSWLDQKAR